MTAELERRRFLKLLAAGGAAAALPGRAGAAAGLPAPEPEPTTTPRRSMGASDMQSFGMVPAEVLRRPVVISPHMDDAVLGCSQLIDGYPGTLVITVFAGTPDAYPEPMTDWDTTAGFRSGDDVVAARREEDRNALAELGARPLWLDFVEYQYLERPRWVQPEHVVSTLAAALRDAGATAVFAPFGLANPDHVCTHRAAMLAREQLPELAWFCYEDTGYKSIPGVLIHRIAEMRARGIWATPASPEVPAGYARRDAAMRHYPSQLRALEHDWKLSARLAAPAPEQYWSLGPRIEQIETWLDSL